MSTNEKRLIPLSKRIIYGGDVFNSLMMEKKWSATEAADFVKGFRTVEGVEVVHGQNISPMHPVDEFQCSKCGIILRDWVEVTIDEEELDEQYNEYELKFCPNCGVKLDGGNDDGKSTSAE